MVQEKKPLTVLELKNVSKTYKIGDEEIRAMQDVNIKIRRGEFIAIIGPSGSGKSTFLQVSSILAEPTSGEIFLNNREVGQYDEVERAKLRNKEIGFIFQQFNLLARTSSWENVALPLIYAKVPAADRKKRAINALNSVGLGDRLNNQPSQLSGGQQQRVAIARALVNNPAIIFADEPTGNLDSVSSEEIKAQLINLHEQGKTVIVVTHDADVAQITNRIVNFKDGKITSDEENKPVYPDNFRELINKNKQAEKVKNGNIS